MDFKKTFSQLRTGDLVLRPNSLNARQGVGQALFPQGYWFNKTSSTLVADDHVNAKQMRSENEVELLREKEKTLSSLEKFVVEKTEQSSGKQKKVLFKGGEIKLNKSDQSLSVLDLDYLPTIKDLPKTLIDKKNNQLNYIFLGDNFISSESNEVNETETQEDLLIKMITAMKLDFAEYIRLPFTSSDFNSDEVKVLAGILLHKTPKIIITMGAVATNNLLGKKERLSRVHGKIFDRTIEFKKSEKINIKIMPLFHPDFLKINPNMKRAAWIDLQKAMEYLSKV